MTALDFQFVQGSERLDWGVLVSIDIQRLIKDTNVDTLQRVVENIAFARLTRDEAAMFTPDHFIHLYTLCQLVIQYLVCSQECLAKINVKLNERMQESQQGVDSLKQECDRLNQENSVLRKEVKAQRRTLLAYEYNRAGRNATAGSTYICPQCGEMYGKCESLQSHIRKRHMMKPAVESPLVQVQPQQQPQTALEPPRQPEQWKTDYDLKMHQLQDKLSSIEQLLEKERDRNDRLQREGMMMMMQAALIGQKPASPVPPSAEGGKADVQAGQPISPQQQKLEQTKSEPTLPGLPTVQAAGVAALPHRNSQQSLFAVPVVPDVAALQQYNNTRQQEASNSALVKQVEELQKVVKSLKEGKQSDSALPATSVSGNAAGLSASPSWLTVNEMQQGNAEKPAISALLSSAANVGSANAAKVGPDTNTSVPPLQTQPLRAVQELNPQCVAMTQQPLMQQQHPLDLQRETRTLPTATQQLPLQQPVALHPTASATIPLAPQQVPPATAQMVQQHPSDPHYQTHAFPTATQRTSLDQQQPITGLTTITAPPIESPKIQTAQQTSTHLATQQAPNPQHVPSTQQPLAPASIQQQHPLVEPNQIYAPSAVPQQLPFPGARPAVPQPLQPQPQPQLLPSAPQAATAPPVQQQQEVTKGEPQTVPAPHTSVAPPSLSQQPQPHTVTEVVHNTSHLTAGVVAPVDVMPITSAARPSKCIVSNCASSMASMGSLPQLFSTLKPPGQVQNSGKSSLLDDSLSVRPKPSTAAPGVDCQVVQHLVSSSKPSTAASSCTPEWLRNDSITDSGRNGATGRGYAPTGGTNFAIPKESNVVPTAPTESPPGLASTTGVAVSPPGTHPNAGLEASNSAIRAIPVPVQQHQPGPKVIVPPFAASLPVPVPATSPPLSLGSGVAPMHVATGVAQASADVKVANISVTDLSSGGSSV